MSQVTAARRVIVPPPSARLLTAVPQALPLYALGGATMGTRWSVKYAGRVAPAALEPRIVAELQQVIDATSSWEPGSALSRYNRAPAGTWVELPPTLATVVAAGLEVARATDGAFDPTLGALVDLWGFGAAPSTQRPPSIELLTSARASAGWRRLAFDEARARLYQPGGVQLDLSGIAKGHGVDRVVGLLAESGIEDCLVEIGGELRGAGCKPDGLPWWVGVDAPPAIDGSAVPPTTVIALHDLSVATSGDHRRQFVHDGHRYHHTLDPRTGQPVVAAPAAVTVLHPSCMLADAWATALTVLGTGQGLACATARGLAALFVERTEHGLRERLTPAFAALQDGPL
jgi:thiamine biosynthesis lipoprotein